MDKKVFEANEQLQKDMYESNINEFNVAKNKELLKTKYKDHNMRFSLVLCKNIALENNNLEFASFLDNIINEMTKEISLINEIVKNGDVEKELEKISFHDKVNIIFYVRPNFYDEEYEPYEILTETAYNELSKSIIDDANMILSRYNKNINEWKNMNLKDIHSLINNKELCLDLLFATELIK